MKCVPVFDEGSLKIRKETRKDNDRGGRMT